jgi:uncharacterized protein YjiS (DUF1127 family)
MLSRQAGFSDTPRLCRAWRDAASWLRRRRQYHAAVRELAALDERMLKDIGITRGDIPAVARGQFSRSDGVHPEIRHE